MQDSNLRIHESKSCALPTWLIPNIYVVSAQGFEPRTHALEGRCSIQLSYAPTIYICISNKNGADEGSRTPTPMALDPKSSASANSATSAHFFGGGWWIRTTEVDDNRFTVCPLWPLGKSSVLIYMELVIGIEPTTCWLQVSCSTVEPHQHFYFGDLEGARTLDLQRDRLAF